MAVALNMPADSKLILSLVNRLGEKLPSSAGGGDLDDPLIVQNAQSLISLSEHRLSIVSSGLATMLENISKPNGPSDGSVNPVLEKSQLFVLQTLWRCMSHHWECYRKTLDLPKPIPVLAPLAPGEGGSANEAPATIRPLSDPPALDEALVKQLLALSTRFLQIESGELSSELHKAAGQVLFYISASNFPIFYARIKTRIQALSVATDENADSWDLYLLEHINLNSRRLSEILQELSASCRSFKRTVLINLAVILRKAIWNWINAHPMEFVSLCQSQRRLAGGPDILFDIFDSMADNHKKKMVFWPVQTMLLTLCPDILLSITLREGNSAVTSGKSVFLNNLKKSLKTKNLADVAAVSYVDICKASTYVSKNDKMSALRHLVPEIENELKDRLFDPQHPFTNQDGVVDQQLMIDCLTASFRLNSRNVIWSLFPICLQEDAPAVFKLVLVKSCLQIASEENRLPWNPTISATYTNLASPLRKLFQEYLQKERVVEANRKGTSLSSLSLLGKKTTQAADEDSKTDLDIQLIILSLYIVDPKLALFSTDAKTQREDNRNLIFGLTLCLQDANLRVKAGQALLGVHQPVFIEQWGPIEELMSTFWEISSQVTLSLAKQIVDRDEQESGVRALLGLLQEILLRRNEFLRAHPDTASVGSAIPDHSRATVMLEIALLVLLCSPDTEIGSIAGNCLGCLCIEAELIGDLDDSHPMLGVVDNIEVYKELASTGGVVTGRQLQQKRIRKLLRLIERPTSGNVAAWEEAYRRWVPLITAVGKAAEEKDTESKESRSGLMTSNYFKNSSDKSREKVRDNVVTQEEKGEWQNFTGFLCALGGVCLASSLTSSETKSLPNLDLPVQSQSKISNDGPGTIRSYIAGPINAQQSVYKFVDELLEWLVCDSVSVRETVKDAIGMEISPALYPILFSSIRNRVETFFDQKNDSEVIATDRATLFIEQTVSVVRFILERLTTFSEPLSSVDLESLLMMFSKYLNRLGRGSNSLRIKIKMAAMAEVLMTKREFISFRQEIKFRNKLLESFVEWTSDFAAKTETPQPSEDVNQNQKLSRDLDLACLKTILALLYQLPLQPMVSSVEIEMSGLTEARAMLFYKYFSFLTKLLNRCRVLDSFERGTHSGKMTKDLQELLNRSKDAVKDLGPLRDYTILAMSNMLSANIDSGLKYSLGMGYHEDPKTRTAFMQVLTNILNQGTEFGELAEDALQDRYDKLVDLLVQPDLLIATALCDACPVGDADDLAPLLVSIFESRNRTQDLINVVVEREVFKTDAAPGLFRRNSMATKLITAYFKICGFEYLTNTLRPAFTTLRDLPLGETESFEVDPARLKPNEDSVANMGRLLTLSKQFLDCILTSASKMPTGFCEVCYVIRRAVEQRFPEASTTAVGGLIFLRFFCPAIVAPDAFGLVKDMSMKDPRRRGLVLITKGIQNLANRVELWSKEAFMAPLNETLRLSLPKVEDFLRSISAAVENKADHAFPANHLEESDLARLQFHLTENLERIGKELAARRLPTAIEAVAGSESEPASNTTAIIDPSNAAKKYHDTLTQLLAQLGPVPDQAVKGKSVNLTKLSATNQLFLEFMQRNAKRNVEHVKAKKIFFECGVSKERRAVFYYIARKFILGQVDEELLIYYIMQTLKPGMGKPFDVVVDLTQFTADNEVQNQWVTQFLQILPFDAASNVTNIYLYNANTAFKKYAKRMSRFMTAKTQKKLFFISTLAEFSDYILPSELQLPKSTVALETDITNKGAVFSPVLKLSQFYTHVPVIFKVGTETIHVTTLKKQEIFGLLVTVNDIFHVSEIEEVSVVNKGTETEFTIKFERGTSSVSFSSAKGGDIARALLTAKARFNLSKPTNVAARMIRPKDVPGTLLNMALLNMGSDDPALRQAAYNLLYSLSIAFNFDAGNQLLEAKGLCIPANNTSFVIAIANKLSATEPHLTLEFLSEGLVGFKKSSMELKHLALEYMAPWLNNLALFCSPSGNSDSQQKLGKTEEILRQLIEVTVEEAEMYPSLQSKVWHTIAMVPETLDLVLDAFIKYALQNQLGSRQAEVMADTAVTLASANVAIVAGKLISRLRRVIGQSCSQPVALLSQHPVWEEVCILLRFALMLSFNNRLNVQQYLPELCHIVSMVVATGPVLIRASVHGLVVNIVQSLCTSVQLSEDNLRNLTLLLSQFSEPKYRLLFGVSRGGATNAFLTQDASDDHVDKLSLYSLETITASLLEVITCSASQPDTAATWLARWMSLISSTAFKPNPALQPRAFVMLGCLARHTRVNDELLLFQILLSLVDALEAFQEDDSELIVAIVMCLTRMTINIPSDSRFLRALFWVGVGIVQISHVELFTAGIDLLDVILRTLESRGFFQDTTLEKFLIQARQPLEAISKQLDSLLGVQFNTNFSFAIATTLLRGLKHPSTKTATVRLLTTFLEISGGSNRTEELRKQEDRTTVSARLLGFLAPLLPITEQAELNHLLLLAGISEAKSDDTSGSSRYAYFRLFDRLVLLDDISASLLISLMATMLQNAEYETEILFIYSFFAEAAVAIPDVFIMVYESLVPKMTQIMGSSQNAKIIEAVQSILYTMVSTPRSTEQNKSRKSQQAYLSEIGFSGLTDCGSFAPVTKARKKQCATLAAQLIQSILK